MSRADSLDSMYFVSELLDSGVKHHFTRGTNFNKAGAQVGVVDTEPMIKSAPPNGSHTWNLPSKNMVKK